MDVFVLGSYVNAHVMTVGQLPVPGESVQATRLWSEHGGKGLNLAVAMHRLGLQVCTVLAVGNDMPGQNLSGLLRAEGMDSRWVVTVEDSASGFGVGMVAEDGGNTIAVYPGANNRLAGCHVEAASTQLNQCRAVCAQFEVPDEPILTAFRLARRQGIATLLNPSPWRSPAPALLALTDILVVNATEAACLFGLDTKHPPGLEQWLQRLPELGWAGRLLVITLAEQGCVSWADDRVMHQPAWTVTAQDPTGAGDAFTAGLVFALLGNYPLAAALRFANACGAGVVARAGVWSVLPTRAQVEAFMAQQPGADSDAG